MADDAYISSSAGATFLKGVIVNTLEASSSAFVGGALNVTGNTTLAGTFNANNTVTLGNAASDVTTATAQFTASEGLELGNALFVNNQKIYGIGELTASVAKIEELQVNVLKSTTTTAHNVDMSGSIIVASGAADAADADGFGLVVSGANAHLTWDNSNSRMNLSKPLAVAGHISPTATNTYDLGSDTVRFRNIYTGDLHLKNERGNWTIVEEEDYLCVINNITGKRYKMVLQEIEN